MRFLYCLLIIATINLISIKHAYANDGLSIDILPEQMTGNVVAIKRNGLSIKDGLGNSYEFIDLGRYSAKLKIGDLVKVYWVAGDRVVSRIIKVNADYQMP